MRAEGAERFTGPVAGRERCHRTWTRNTGSSTGQENTQMPETLWVQSVHLHTCKAQAVKWHWWLLWLVLFGDKLERIETGSLKFKRKQQSPGQGWHLTKEHQETCCEENSRREVTPDQPPRGQDSGLCYNFPYSLVPKEEFVRLATQRWRSSFLHKGNYSDSQQKQWIWKVWKSFVAPCAYLQRPKRCWAFLPETIFCSGGRSTA